MPVKPPDQEVKGFDGLQQSMDPFDTGASGPVVLTNLTANVTGILVTRLGWLPVTFESAS